MMKLQNKVWLGLLAIALATALAGCESDPVAPQDELPALTGQDVAGQSAIVAQALVVVGPYILDPSKVVEDVTITSADVNGTVHIDYRDGPDGNPTSAAAAAWARLFTDPGEPVVVNFGDLGGETGFDLDVTGDIDRSPDMVTILAGSGGTMTSGDYATSFTMDGVVIDGGDYPAAGTVTATPSSGPSASITFDGSNTARATVGMQMYDVNLDTGEVTEAVVPI